MPTMTLINRATILKVIVPVCRGCYMIFHGKIQPHVAGRKFGGLRGGAAEKEG
jgi:hypothetical protein